MDSVDSEALAAVEADLLALEGMSLSDLREFWSARWGFAPRLRSVALLRHMIGWRLQSALLGGLDDGTRDLLCRKSIPRAPRPCSGTRLTREYRGVLHEVEVRDETFSYAGREYGRPDPSAPDPAEAQALASSAIRRPVVDFIRPGAFPA